MSEVDATSVGSRGWHALIDDPVARVSELERALSPAGSKARDPDWLLRRMLLGADALAITVALAAATLLVGPDSDASRFGVAMLTIPAWWIVFKLYGMYDRDSKRVSHSTLDDVPWLFHALIVGSLGLWLLLRWVDPEAKLILVEGIAFAATAFVMVIAMRGLVRALPFLRLRRVLVVGGGPLSALLVRKIKSHPELGLIPVGYLRGGLEGGNFPPGMQFLEFLGDVDEIDEACRRTGCDRVVVVSAETDHDRLPDLIHELRKRRLPISLVPTVSDTLGPSVEVDDIEGVTILGVNPPVLSRSSRALKRAIDVAIAAVVLLLTLPLTALAAVAIRLSSPGPAIFRQQRIGRRGKPFTLYKLRTMVDGAAEQTEELMERSGHSAWLLLEADHRVTAVGRRLRRTAIDELPQLWNVLRGEMSLVGPRPMTPEIYEHISERDLHRLDLTPGITGLWQVLGRTAIPFEEMLKLDYVYVTNWSLWQDLRLLLRTLPAVARGRGAN